MLLRDSIRLGLLLASFNYLDICYVDIGNAYLNYDCREKVCCASGPELNVDQGLVIVVVRDMYGLKSEGEAWRAMLNRVIKNGFQVVFSS